MLPFLILIIQNLDFFYEMKQLVISEIEKQQIISLYEQIYPKMGDKSKNEIKFTKEQIEKAKKLTPPEALLDVDDLVNQISLFIDVIPGLGEIVSASIDILHSLTYFYRAEFGSNEKKSENYFLAITTLILAFVPIAGNVTMLGISKFIKEFTPTKIKQLVGFSGPIFNLEKNLWKYSFIIWLKKQGVNLGQNELATMIDKIIIFSKKITSSLLYYLNPPLVYLIETLSNKLITLLRELISLWGQVKI